MPEHVSGHDKGKGGIFMPWKKSENNKYEIREEPEIWNAAIVSSTEVTGMIPAANEDGTEDSYGPIIAGMDIFPLQTPEEEGE